MIRFGLSGKAEEEIKVLARYKETIPRALLLDIIEMYLMDHKHTIVRAREWVKQPKSAR